MKGKNLYQALSEEFENDIEYKIEYKILEITEQICSVMKERQITRAELSRKLGTSKTAVTKMLDGSTNFTLRRLIKIADALEKEFDIHLTRDPGEGLI
ncbi:MULTISPECIES: helix-turn-helix domain-containing protein [Desulfotignum]|uniref:Cro/C1-type HTH DNA-binding domain-containing protein n=1 Tax=Desulfotignum phosphitoxidans DSM 13687 TaxID=1286635 RepID=S0G546_9BACT|nr:MULTISPECIES: helix-turn-helix transcriptional regulator [Desulfotignum]EMS79166.1 Cro/C1-type HTH DNA-binding domain-containing protein [Desulfotignum phosphitoxidans DSM 13687]